MRIWCKALAVAAFAGTWQAGASPALAEFKVCNQSVEVYNVAIGAEQVRKLLLKWFPEAQVKTAGDDWTAITITFPSGRKLTLLHDRDYYAGEGWSNP